MYRALMTVELRRAQDQFAIVRDYFDKVEQGHLVPPDPVFRGADESAKKPSAPGGSDASKPAAVGHQSSTLSAGSVSGTPHTGVCLRVCVTPWVLCVLHVTVFACAL